MKTHTARRPRKGSQEALYESRLEIGLTPTAWRAVRVAAVSAFQSGRKEFEFVPRFANHVDSEVGKLGTGNYEAGEPNIAISGTIEKWGIIASAALEFGDYDAKEAGHTIVVGCSQVIHGRKSVATEGE